MSTDATTTQVLGAAPAAADGPEHVTVPVAYDAILLAGFGGDYNFKAFDVNFGLSGMARLAKDLRDTRTRSGWTARFSDEPGFRYVTARLADAVTKAPGRRSFLLGFVCVIITSAISLAGPLSRLTDERIRALGPLVAALTGAPAGRLVDRLGARRLSIAGLIGMTTGSLILSVLPMSFGIGGYVAGRMARFDGARQGLAVWLVGLIVVLLLAAAGGILGSQYNVLQQLNLPRMLQHKDDTVAANVGGVELAATVQLARFASFSTNVTYQDAKLTDFLPDTFAPGGGYVRLSSERDGGPNKILRLRDI